MCKSVIIHRPGGDYVYATCGELRQVAELVPCERGESFMSDDTCLCVVDVESTASRAGYRCSDDDPSGEFDGFDWWWYPKERD